MAIFLPILTIWSLGIGLQGNYIYGYHFTHSSLAWLIAFGFAMLISHRLAMANKFYAGSALSSHFRSKLPAFLAFMIATLFVLLFLGIQASILVVILQHTINLLFVPGLSIVLLLPLLLTLFLRIEHQGIILRFLLISILVSLFIYLYHLAQQSLYLADRISILSTNDISGVRNFLVANNSKDVLSSLSFFLLIAGLPCCCLIFINGTQNVNTKDASPADNFAHSRGLSLFIKTGIRNYLAFLGLGILLILLLPLSYLFSIADIYQQIEQQNSFTSFLGGEMIILEVLQSISTESIMVANIFLVFIFLSLQLAATYFILLLKNKMDILFPPMNIGNRGDGRSAGNAGDKSNSNKNHRFVLDANKNLSFNILNNLGNFNIQINIYSFAFVLIVCLLAGFLVFVSYSLYPSYFPHLAMIGFLVVALMFLAQLIPTALALSYWSYLTSRGVSMGIIAGLLVAGLLLVNLIISAEFSSGSVAGSAALRGDSSSDATSYNAPFGSFWYLLPKIAALGLLVNFVVALIFSYLTQDVQDIRHKEKLQRFQSAFAVFARDMRAWKKPITMLIVLCVVLTVLPIFSIFIFPGITSGINISLLQLSYLLLWQMILWIIACSMAFLLIDRIR